MLPVGDTGRMDQNPCGQIQCMAQAILLVIMPSGKIRISMTNVYSEGKPRVSDGEASHYLRTLERCFRCLRAGGNFPQTLAHGYTHEISWTAH